MKQETEKLIYSLQNQNFSTRGSIKEAKEELLRLLETAELPTKYSAPIYYYIHVLLNSIVAEITVTENAPVIPVSISCATDKELIAMLQQGYSEHYMTMVKAEIVIRELAKQDKYVGHPDQLPPFKQEYLGNFTRPEDIL